MEVIGAYLGAVLEWPTGKAKTCRWMIRGRGRLLGHVAWHGPWRCYAFFPQVGTLYNAQCMRDLAQFCEHRRAWRWSDPGGGVLLTSKAPDLEVK